ncbi:MAG: helix-turn-helix domain-containing protein [Gemmatimonadota bacterium]
MNTLPTVATAPVQQRARALIDRVAAATSALLAERDFEDITVADIARRAGVSVGVVYTRFATKEHLLAHLARDLTPALLARVESALAEERTATLSIREIAERYFLIAATAFVRHRAVLRPLSLIVRIEAHRELRLLTASFNAGVHAILRQRLLAHREHIHSEDPEAAVDFAILAASAALREVVLYGDPVSRLSRHQRQVVSDCARLCASFLVSRNDEDGRSSSPENRS